MSIATSAATPAAAATDRIACAICGQLHHAIAIHLRDDHADLGMSITAYQEKYPDAPIYSATALAAIEKRRATKVADTTAAAAAPVTVSLATGAPTKEAFHTTFGLDATPATMSTRGSKPILISVMANDPARNMMVPDIDHEYVFNIDILKSLMMAIEIGIPTYLWGHAGVGKTTIFEQIAARTRRPFMRVQHTANMEEEHIVGGWRLRDGKTVFDLGPLALAMREGWLYVADEYDFGRPEVTSVYQAVLEGKPLVIKEADSENRVIRPHPQFRMVATGNTNGQGDESGLYQGTNMQNAANYERFGVVERMPYMSPDLEARMISVKAGIPVKDATKLVDFATRIRNDFDGAKIGNPISPRSLIYAAQIGLMRMDYRVGLQQAFINRLTAVDREAATQLAQRVFA